MQFRLSGPEWQHDRYLQSTTDVKLCRARNASAPPERIRGSAAAAASPPATSLPCPAPAPYRFHQAGPRPAGRAQLGRPVCDEHPKELTVA
eukprot:CAMPEP_0172181352 /NCGR_PEP_ID=MMETSP1050-20130122/17767_1 /TAXON_ID=233186 /ORGANISM="Cryptomonas curvata, Strain CCAP979/52" /LENGTH=90 /DNA_ID=CAMNT_0012854619 /DNA_START=756 /DNA_END=1024 /DNA_ORIENTATION=-